MSYGVRGIARRECERITIPNRVGNDGRLVVEVRSDRELWVVSYELREESTKSKDEGYGLRVASYGLRVTGCGLRKESAKEAFKNGEKAISDHLEDIIEMMPTAIRQVETKKHQHRCTYACARPIA